MTWLDKYGKPMADYEVHAIEDDGWRFDDDAIAYLGFEVLNRGLAGFDPTSCNTCGALFTADVRHLRAHRRLCGWDNGRPAWTEEQQWEERRRTT